MTHCHVLSLPHRGRRVRHACGPGDAIAGVLGSRSLRLDLRGLRMRAGELVAAEVAAPHS